MCILFFNLQNRTKLEDKNEKINKTENVQVMLKEGFSENIIPMKRLEVTEAYKTLGIYITPEGNQKV